MARKPRENSHDFRSRRGAKTGKIFIAGIPLALHTKFRARLRHEGRSMRAVVLSLITEWLRHERNGTLVDSERGRFAYEDSTGNLVPLGAEETGAGGEDYGQPGLALSPGVVRRMAGAQRDDSDGGESVITAMLWEEIEKLRTRMDRLHEALQAKPEAGDAASS